MLIIKLSTWQGTDHIIEKIKEIFYANKKRYGYRRITLELKNQGININHKKVLRIMKKFNLQSITHKRKRKYSSPNYI